MATGLDCILLARKPVDAPEAGEPGAEEIDDLLLEARNYLDGEPIANEEQANAVSSLLNRLRRVAKDADEARKTEKKPHDEAAKAVQAKWTPIIDKAELAASTAKQVLAPWLRKIEEQQQHEAELARREAARLAGIAANARATAGDLQAQEDAERLLKAAVGASRGLTPEAASGRSDCGRSLRQPSPIHVLRSNTTANSNLKH
jgi:hypothetical protein